MFLSQWLHKHKNFMLRSRQNFWSKPKQFYFGLSFLVFVATLVTFWAITKGQVMEKMWTDQCMINVFKSVRVCVAVVGFLAIAAVYVLVSIRGSEDNFRIYWEGKILVCSTLLCGIAAFIAVIIPEQLILLPGFMYWFWIVLIFIPCEIIVISMTFGLIYYIDQDKKLHPDDEEGEKRTPSEEKSSQNSSKVRTRRLPSSAVEGKDHFLERALQDDALIILFERFLVKEFSVENLLLYRAAVSLEEKMKRTNVDRQSTADEFFARAAQRKTDYTAFFEVFFTENSRLEVNVSADSKNALAKVYHTLNKIDPQTVPRLEWAQAQLDMSKAVEMCRREVFQMMKKDSFARFRNSPDFKEWKIKLGTPASMELGYVVEEDDEQAENDEKQRALSSASHPASPTITIDL
jgi:hypothetical protein